MAGYNREFYSRLIANGFAFSFGQHESIGRSLTFRVSAYSQGRPGEEIRYMLLMALSYLEMTLLIVILALDLMVAWLSMSSYLFPKITSIVKTPMVLKSLSLE